MIVLCTDELPLGIDRNQGQVVLTFCLHSFRRKREGCSVSWCWYIPSMGMLLHHSRKEHVIGGVEQDVERAVLL